MPSEHAKLSPSSAERWISCPASIRMAELVPKEEDSPYAAEGTRAHAWAEVEAARYFKLITDEEYEQRKPSTPADPDMARYVELYIDVLEEALEERDGSVLMLEQRLQTGIPRCWGTSDAVIVSPTHVHVIDFKYGQGVKVSAVDNPQLQLYGVSALEEYGDLLGEVEDVTMTIFQPRIGHRSTTSVPARELRAWRDSLIPIAESALGPDAPFGPGEDACRWCPVRGRCAAQAAYALDTDFGTPADVLTPEEVGVLLDKIPAISAWCREVEAYALDLAYSQETPIPGWKVVRSGGRRTFTDPTYTVQTLIERGYTAEQVAKVGLRPLSDLSKVLGKDDFEYLRESGQMTKAPGKPSLVRESDPGTPISPNAEARRDFDNG